MIFVMGRRQYENQVLKSMFPSQSAVLCTVEIFTVLLIHVTICAVQKAPVLHVSLMLCALVIQDT